MGIFDRLTKEFIAVIDWTESENGVLAYRFPMKDREIRTGAQLTVRETQVAVFLNEGEIADLLPPGLHTLNTQTLPVLTTLRNWDKGFKSPFKSDVIFFSTREQIDQKWGTSSPITIRDKEFGAIRIRAHGTYSYQIKDPKVFFKKIAGTREAYTAQDLEGQLRAAILTSLASFFGGSEIGFVDMAANQTQFSETLKTALLDTFKQYGLGLQTFYVQSITLPEELQGYLDRKAGMNMLGDLGKYTQFQAAETLGKPQGVGGVASSAAEMAAGLAVGQSIAQTLAGNTGGAAKEDPIATINKLHELFKQGILTQAEFDAKKAELLKKIT